MTFVKRHVAGMDMKKNNRVFLEGMRDAIPIALGYFAVAFSLGIMARRVGLTPLQGFLSGILNHASAGEYAEFTVIAADSSYLEMAFVIFVTNSRYLLMSCALSQRFAAKTPIYHRVLVGFGITDEIFGISIAGRGDLNPYYSYGAILLSLPAWAAGTACGIMVGNVLPASLVSALSVALYGMFLAIIIPPARKNRVVRGLVPVSFLCSFIALHIEWFAGMSESLRTIILTVVIAGTAAAVFPVKEENA